MYISFQYKQKKEPFTDVTNDIRRLNDEEPSRFPASTASRVGIVVVVNNDAPIVAGIDEGLLRYRRDARRLRSGEDVFAELGHGVHTCSTRRCDNRELRVEQSLEDFQLGEINERIQREPHELISFDVSMRCGGGLLLLLLFLNLGKETVHECDTPTDEHTILAHVQRENIVVRCSLFRRLGRWCRVRIGRFASMHTLVDGSDHGRQVEVSRFFE